MEKFLSKNSDFDRAFFGGVAQFESMEALLEEAVTVCHAAFRSGIRPIVMHVSNRVHVTLPRDEKDNTVESIVTELIFDKWEEQARGRSIQQQQAVANELALQVCHRATTLARRALEPICRGASNER